MERTRASVRLPSQVIREVVLTTVPAFLAKKKQKKKKEKYVI